MSKKPTGLSAFAVKRPEPPAAPVSTTAQPESAPVSASKRTRGQGDTVALTVRVSRADWTRLHQLAVAEGVSLQTLALRGFSRVFEDQGLPGFE